MYQEDFTEEKRIFNNMVNVSGLNVPSYPVSDLTYEKPESSHFLYQIEKKCDPILSKYSIQYFVQSVMSLYLK